MKKQSIVIFILLLCNIAYSAVVWQDNMSSLTWIEESGAIDEAGPGTGGIRAMGNHIQMNSWWDDAVWTQMWKDTGIIIQDESDYTLTASMESYSSGTPVTIEFQNPSQGWSVITSDSPSISTSSFTDYSISFSTAGSINDGLIGNEIGIAIIPGSWNNMAVTHVSIDAEAVVISDITPPDPNPMTWETVPFAKNTTTVSMIATRAVDDLNNVEYFFDCTTDAGFSSSWQTSSTYICNGLTTGTPYSFRVKARDTSSNNNETGYSSTESATPTSVIIDYPQILPGTGGDLATTNSSQLTLTVDVEDQKQIVEGFGASDCWSAQYIGQWPSSKTNAIADLLFETEQQATNELTLTIKTYRHKAR